MPVVHVRLPETLVNVGFWSGLTGAVMFGVIVVTPFLEYVP